MELARVLSELELRLVDLNFEGERRLTSAFGAIAKAFSLSPTTVKQRIRPYQTKPRAVVADGVVMIASMGLLLPSGNQARSRQSVTMPDGSPTKKSLDYAVKLQKAAKPLRPLNRDKLGLLLGKRLTDAKTFFDRHQQPQDADPFLQVTLDARSAVHQTYGDFTKKEAFRMLAARAAQQQFILESAEFSRRRQSRMVIGYWHGSLLELNARLSDTEVVKFLESHQKQRGGTRSDAILLLSLSEGFDRLGQGQETINTGCFREDFKIFVYRGKGDSTAAHKADRDYWLKRIHLGLGDIWFFLTFGAKISLPPIVYWGSRDEEIYDEVNAQRRKNPRRIDDPWRYSDAFIKLPPKFLEVTRNEARLPLLQKLETTPFTQISTLIGAEGWVSARSLGTSA